MNFHSRLRAQGAPAIHPQKFRDPDVTLTGEPRAKVGLKALETLWFNTGTLCNIACANCYIESTPTNDRLVYLTLADVEPFLDEIAHQALGTREIAFTGGEPFMNPEIIEILDLTLSRGFQALVLTNAMQPLMRPRVQEGLTRLREAHGNRLSLRVSLDHFTQDLHEDERGPDTWNKALTGLAWLGQEGFDLSIAGRSCWQESEAEARAGYGALFARLGLALDAEDPSRLVLFPEMDETVDVPEITTGCWDIVGVKPADMMCASSRMVVKRKGADRATVLPCTLLPYDERFEMGATLAAAARAEGGQFAKGAVKLNHPHCAKFCVLGGGSCSVG